MPLADYIFAGNEEHGKKDDDRKPRKSVVRPFSWTPRQSITSFRRRRVVFALVVVLLIYLFIHNLPTDLGPYSQRGDSRLTNRGTSSAQKESPTGPPPRPSKHPEGEDYYYEGRIKFYHLAASLYAVSNLVGHSGANKNVLFAASSLKSASEIIPLACEMTQWNRNNVHLALMGRDDLSIEEIKELNGVNDEDCKIYWHDARPDFSRWSSEYRMEVSIAASLGYLQSHVRPQVIITDHASREDRFFIKSLRSKANELDKSIIELPVDASEKLMWLTRLDSGSLAAWHTTYVDLVIHAPPKSSGSLIRLMKSIEAADYFGSRRPHITIELPAEIDSPTLDFLENIVWPPIDGSGSPHASQITLRHRLPRYGFTTAEASTHFIESFYPARPKDSHVLLLSPQAELSPIFYHYLMYNLLEYKYSNYGEQSQDSKNLMGLSLELPSFYLNNSAELVPPTLSQAGVGSSTNKDEQVTPFLWQAPNSNAALYFGDKWIELHSFLSSRITIQDPDLSDDERPPSRQKIISEYYPAWMEYVQELMRVRAYSLLYPNFPENKDTIVTIHNELYQPPEEYKSSRSLLSSAAVPTLNPGDPFTVDPSAHLSKPPTGSESPLITSSLMSILPNAGDLPEIPSLPILSFEGNILSDSLSETTAQNFASDFRREIGRCGSDHIISIDEMSADDLFCNLGNSEAPLDLEPESEGEPDQMDNISKTHSQKMEQGTEKKSQQPLNSQAEKAKGESEKKATEISKEAVVGKTKLRSDEALSHPDNSKLAQKEFTEHLRRQGVQKSSGKDNGPTSEMSDKKSDTKPHVVEEERMKEGNTAFEVINGNLVRKEKKIDESSKAAEPGLGKDTSTPEETNSKEASSANVPDPTGKPVNNENYDSIKKEGNKGMKDVSADQVKAEGQNPAKGTSEEILSGKDVQGTEVEEVAKQSEVVISNAPIETKRVLPERDRGW